MLGFLIGNIYGRNQGVAVEVQMEPEFYQAVEPVRELKALLDSMEADGSRDDDRRPVSRGAD